MKRLLLVGFLLLVFAPEASAKMCVRIETVPARPVAGVPATIRVTALSIVVRDGRARPGDQLIGLSPQTRLNVRAAAPDGTVRTVLVRRTARSVLVGRFIFRSAGAWTLSWAAWPNDANPACAGTKRVRVNGR